MQDGRKMREEKIIITQLIPKPLWGENPRTAFGKSGWDRIRKQVYKDAGYRCEVCGGRGHHHPVEAHELYIFEPGLVTCVGIIALCPMCHKACHPARTCSVDGETEYLKVRKHMATVNNWTEQQVQKYWERCLDEWRCLSSIPDWKTDWSYVEEIYQTNLLIGGRNDS